MARGPVAKPTGHQNLRRGHTMLGDKVYQSGGNITGRRVLQSDGGPRVETSLTEMGTLLGVEITSVVTCWAELQPDGSLYSEGQGVVRGKSGEVGSFKRTGVGKHDASGVVSFRGALYYRSASPSWAALNGAAVIFEH